MRVAVGERESLVGDDEGVLAGEVELVARPSPRGREARRGRRRRPEAGPGTDTDPGCSSGPGSRVRSATPCSSSRILAATAACPGRCFQEWIRGSSTTGSAAAASNDSAATDSQASSSRRASTTSRAARPIVTAFELMKASPSRGPRRARATPASARATPASTSSSPRHTCPSPWRARAMSARLVRSPVPERAELTRERREPGVERPDQRVRAARAPPRRRRPRSGWPGWPWRL